MLQRYDLGSNEGEILCKRCHSEPASRQLLQGSNRRVLVKAVNGPGQELVRAWPGGGPRTWNVAIPATFLNTSVPVLG